MSTDAPMTAYVDGKALEQRPAPVRPATHARVRDFAPERLERRAHRCGIVTEDGTPCVTWTLQRACYRHRRQSQAAFEGGE